MRPALLTRDQEYAIIASDMRRLLLVSAVLTVVMLVILFLAG